MRFALAFESCCFLCFRSRAQGENSARVMLPGERESYWEDISARSVRERERKKGRKRHQLVLRESIRFHFSLLRSPFVFFLLTDT